MSWFCVEPLSIFPFSLSCESWAAAGALGIPDLLMVVLIADAAQNGMARGYESVTEGVVLCLTIVAWSYTLDWVAYRFPALQPWIEAPPLALIVNGRIQRRNLRQEMISEEELLSQLRQQGVEDVNQVKKAYMEPDGHISVVRIDPSVPPRKKSTTGLMGGER